MRRDEILLLLRERIRGFAASRIGEDLAEDLAQEVLMVLEQKYAGVSALDELLPLSLQILRFKMAAARRKMLRRGETTAVPVEDANLQDGGANPEIYAARQELLRALTKAIPRLGERCREIFRLKLLGKTFVEIAEDLDVSSVNTIYTQDARCRKRLLELLGGHWEKR